MFNSSLAVAVKNCTYRKLANMAQRGKICYQLTFTFLLRNKCLFCFILVTSFFRFFVHNHHRLFLFQKTIIHSLYICLQELRIISISVVNMTEESQCCQLDLGRFLAWLERFIQRNHKKQKKERKFFLSFYVTIFYKRKWFSSKSTVENLRTDIWD